MLSKVRGEKKDATICGVIQINTSESASKRAALLIEADQLRRSIRRMELRLQQIEIQLRDEHHDREELFKWRKDPDAPQAPERD